MRRASYSYGGHGLEVIQVTVLLSPLLLSLVFLIFGEFGLVEEDTSRLRVNGARDGQQRNGASHDEVGQRDEGMEISDG